MYVYMVQVHLSTSCQYINPAATATLVGGNLASLTCTVPRGDVTAAPPHWAHPEHEKWVKPSLMLSGMSDKYGE